MSDDRLLETEIKEKVYPMVAVMVVGVSVLLCENDYEMAIGIVKKAVDAIDEAKNKKKREKK